MKKTLIFILLLYTTSSCVLEDSLESYTQQFTQWTSAQNYNFEEYIVLEFNGCHYCHDLMVKFIQNEYLPRVKQKAFVLVINDKSELYPIRNHLNNSNLLIYNLQKEPRSILNNSPRIYSQADNGEFEFKLLTSETLTQKLEKMIYVVTTNTRIIDYTTEKIAGIPIPGNENFMAYSDSSSLIYYVENFEMLYEVQD